MSGGAGGGGKLLLFFFSPVVFKHHDALIGSFAALYWFPLCFLKTGMGNWVWNWDRLLTRDPFNIRLYWAIRKTITYCPNSKRWFLLHGVPHARLHMNLTDTWRCEHLKALLLLFSQQRCVFFCFMAPCCCVWCVCSQAPSSDVEYHHHFYWWC